MSQTTWQAGRGAAALYVRTTEVAVCALPEGHPDHRHFAVHIMWCGGARGEYAVEHNGGLLDADGSWSHGTFRRPRGWPWPEAYERALAVAPTVVYNGVTAAQVAARAAS